MEAALAAGEILVSEELMRELLSVLARPKFARLIGPARRLAFVEELESVAIHVPTTAHVRACRDPDDDHVLALALSGNADVIVTGDQDLLILDPFQGVRILSPRDYCGTRPPD